MKIIKKLNYVRFILIPIIPLYLIIYYGIRFISKPYKFAIPVICVGNITTGGTGKTPAVIMLAKLLKELGFNPGIVSRGYRGIKSKEGAIVTDGSTIFLSPQESGEESFLIAKSLTNVPLSIGSNRGKAIRSLIDRFKVDLILMDDGFQNNTVYKDINIIIIDAVNPFGKGLILPAGDLREPRFSLKRSDFIFINKTDLISNEKLSLLTTKIKRISGNKKIFFSKYGNETLFQINNLNIKLSVKELNNKKILIISGIGNPEGFTRTISKYNPASIKHISYPDHQFYSHRDIINIINKSKQFDLVITTEKDYIKLRDFKFADNFYFMSVSCVIKEADSFKKSIDSYLKKLNNSKRAV